MEGPCEDGQGRTYHQHLVSACGVGKNNFCSCILVTPLLPENSFRQELAKVWETWLIYASLASNETMRWVAKRLCVMASGAVEHVAAKDLAVMTKRKIQTIISTPLS